MYTPRRRPPGEAQRSQPCKAGSWRDFDPQTCCTLSYVLAWLIRRANMQIPDLAALSFKLPCRPLSISNRSRCSSRPCWRWRHRSAGIVNDDNDQCNDRRSAMHRGAAQQDPGVRPCSGNSHHRTIKDPGQDAIRKRGARDALRDPARSRAPSLDQDSPLLG